MFRYLKFIAVIIGLLAITFAYLFFHNQRAQNNAPQTETPAPEEQVFIEMTPTEDCTNECSQYQGDQEKYNYCRAVCGFTVENGVLAPPTSADAELSHDYQVKESAVKESDIKKCQEIKDTNIRNSCQARVTEDVFEQQGGNGF